MAIRFRFALALAGAFALAGCSGSDESEASTTNVEFNSFEVANDIAPIEEPAAAVNAAEIAPAPAPAMEAIPEEARVQEDADAVGMTARVNRGEEPGGNQAAETE
jgi:PBP1b-binding outer membrane lipoprotein LpoB